MNNVVDGLSKFEQISIQQANREFWLNVIVALITFISAILVYLDYRNRKIKKELRNLLILLKNLLKALYLKSQFYLNIMNL